MCIPACVDYPLTRCLPRVQELLPEWAKYLDELTAFREAFAQRVAAREARVTESQQNGSVKAL